MFTSSRTGRHALFHKDLITGVESQLVDFPERVAVDEWTPGRAVRNLPTFGRSVLALPMVGERIPKVLVDTPYRSRYQEDQSDVSPTANGLRSTRTTLGGGKSRWRGSGSPPSVSFRLPEACNPLCDATVVSSSTSYPRVRWRSISAGGYRRTGRAATALPATSPHPRNSANTARGRRRTLPCCRADERILLSMDVLVQLESHRRRTVHRRSSRFTSIPKRPTH